MSSLKNPAAKSFPVFLLFYFLTARADNEQVDDAQLLLDCPFSCPSLSSLVRLLFPLSDKFLLLSSGNSECDRPPFPDGNAHGRDPDAGKRRHYLLPATAQPQPQIVWLVSDSPPGKGGNEVATHQWSPVKTELLSPGLFIIFAQHM